MPAEHPRGLVDTNILILRRRIAGDALPREITIGAVTLAELSAGVHMVMGDATAARIERAARTALLQQVESEFAPIPFGTEATRLFGRLGAAVLATGRTPRRRIGDLMIAATAAAASLPLYTTNPGDFSGLGEIVEVVAVARP